MKKLTKKAIKFLESALLLDNEKFKSLAFIKVDEFDGVTYAVATNGFRLHGVPVEGIEHGLYTIKDGKLVAVDDQRYPQWQDILPDNNTLHMVDSLTVFEYQEQWHVLYSNHAIVNNLFLSDIEAYNKDYIALGQKDHTKIMQFNFDDGVFAVVMPMDFNRRLG